MKIRKVAGLVLYNKNKKILLQHRSDDAPRLPGYWGTFGGGIEEGETPEVAVKRELMEELEYRSVNPQLLFVDEHTQDELTVTFYHFTEEFDESQKLVQHEGQGYGWFTVGEALKLKITDHRRAVLSKIGEFLEGKK